jgi:flagellar basal-body rod modification protein FlgD
MYSYDITNILNSSTLQSTPRTPSPDLDKQGFLQLLVKQLSSQDPLDPMTNDEFVSQLAMFGSLEQQINLNDSFSQFFSFQKLTQASTLLGKQVICLVPSGDSVLPASGVVQQVMMINDSVLLKLSTGDEVPFETVVSVQPGGES